ncbi:hypothetical protein ACL1EU_11965 [Corynebacterium striatum]|nr:hypothetical protein [Corynebacterium striatum]
MRTLAPNNWQQFIAALLLHVGIWVVGLSGSFWLTYWLIAVAFTPLMWWMAAWFMKK